MYQEIAEEFHTWCGRHYGLVEPFQVDDADYVLVMSNAGANTGKAAVQGLRVGGMRIGVLCLRVLRPFPSTAIAAALRQGVGVVYRSRRRGKGGRKPKPLPGERLEVEESAQLKAAWGARYCPPGLPK